MKRRRVSLLPEARDDLQWIYETIASASSVEVAMRYLDRIEAFCQGLELAAERGTSRGDIRPGLRIVGFERRITVAFTVTDNEVVIVRIFYGGADWESAFDTS